MSTVFLSYRQESAIHRARVRSLAEKLRADGIDVAIDQFFAENYPGGPDEGWDQWSATQAKTCNKALLVITAGYARCFEGLETSLTSGFGAALEARLFRNQLYAMRWISDRHRLILLDDTDAAFLPAEIRHLPRFRPAHSEDDFRALTSWIKGAAVPLPMRPAAPSWPPEDTTYDTELADREKEWPLIRASLSGRGAKVLLFEGQSRQGKSGLLGQAAGYARRQGLLTAFVDFKGGLASIADVIDALLTDLYGHLPQTQRSCAEARKSALERDLAALSRPAVLLFDTWEKAAERPDLQEWLVHRLLRLALQAPHLVFLLGGQTVPDIHQCAWGGCSRLLRLGELNEEHWRRWAAKSCPGLPVEYISAYYLAAGGSPGAILPLINNAWAKHFRSP